MVFGYYVANPSAYGVIGCTSSRARRCKPSNFQTVEERQGLKVACPEEVAYIKGWIGAKQVLSLAEPKTGYGQYLIDLIQRAR
jgi:glucose-1-phosphate thymidylyltransferase